jgi:OOP family OmpA-OmpF porin
MRSKLYIAALFASLAASGCATSLKDHTCTPVSSWGAPVYRCLPNTPPPAVVKEEPPPPPPKEEPPPPPPPEEKIELREKVQFKTDSAVLLPASYPTLDEAVKVMKDHPEIKKVRIEGHTDSTSTPDHNQKLSDDRAASVKEYFIKKGVEAERLSSKGYGQDKPIADNNTEEGRSQNRRVEIHITEKHK